MKPYTVIKYDAQHMAEVFFSNGRQNYLAHKVLQDDTEPNGELEPSQNAYLCDTKATAYALAEQLITLYPQYTWIVCANETVLSRPPGDITRAVFTDKGLLPA
jgi:hypothetical protein